MKTYQFKTNVNCGGCLRGVAPFLNENEHITEWNVDLETDDRILTVKTDDETTPTDVVRTVSEAGFTAQPLSRA